MVDVDVEIGEGVHVVGWDGEDDQRNPMNWPTWKRIRCIGIVSSVAFVTPLASSMFAPGVPQLMEEFGTKNEQLGSFAVSAYILGFACGPLLLAPASELYGRSIIYNASNVCFCLCTAACAESRSMAMLTVFRFLAGCFGATPLTIGGGTVADLIPLEKRGAYMAVFALGPLLGPTIGPVAGGYLIAARGWRWVFWLLVIMSAAVTTVTFAFLPETYAPTILEAKARHLRRSTGDHKFKSKLESTLPVKEVFATALIRPLKMLCLSPIILSLSLFTAVSYGYLYLLFTTFPTVFHGQYGFSTGTVGLSYIGLGVGCFLGLSVCGIISDRIQVSRTAKSGVSMPEYRLVPMVYFGICVPIGLLWYGWSAEKHAHWIVPILGTCLVGVGLMGTFMPPMTYLVDAFTEYAASALAATTVLRSVLGAVLPLTGGGVYQQLALGWGNSLLALIALALVPIPAVLERYGERLRVRFDVKF